jgi:replication factor C subunit 1
VTSYVVLGSDAGPAKLKVIEKHKLRTLDEDQFLELIRTRKGPGGINGVNLDLKTKKKLEKEQEAIKQGAREMELMEKRAGKEKEKSIGRYVTFLCSLSCLLCNSCIYYNRPKTIDISSQLWTTRYAPQRLKDICGNKGQVEKLQQWLHDW